ncbi:bifunctional glycosyltransferase family 2/GtrA family protein [Dehalobacter sp. DCM]|uniref:bifunctional glycosyltransferase family 2/GtrA family protein n=1 Tax=Dehalobacter sp. DCM TaxID=2907827 RepID=UPI003081F36E|nr:bifunctional glycosyltransferase family 2/GtrA family protein [Dehalobacter sp. DCM]
MTILIPAYEPDLRLIQLIKEIESKGSFQLVIVDDGSGKKYKHIFLMAEEQGCVVLRHETNQGKGAALKTGFQYLLQIGEADGVVCADSDGQHLARDIMRVARITRDRKGHIILGSRKFTGKVPLRSRFGNTVTRTVFSISAGSNLSDTQTGLRGYSSDMLEWLCGIPGKRFEYEMNILLEAKSAGFSFYEVYISTVYEVKNHSTHFRTFSDSIRVYVPIFKFCASSLIAGVMDFALLLLLQTITSNLLFSVIAARVCSSIVNYTLNSNFVFARGRKHEVQLSALKYFSLVAVIMSCNYGLLYSLNILIGVPLFFAKIMTEVTLFIFSYWCQRNFVFRSDRKISSH